MGTAISAEDITWQNAHTHTQNGGGEIVKEKTDPIKVTGKFIFPYMKFLGSIKLAELSNIILTSFINKVSEITTIFSFLKVFPKMQYSTNEFDIAQKGSPQPLVQRSRPGHKATGQLHLDVSSGP